MVRDAGAIADVNALGAVAEAADARRVRGKGAAARMGDAARAGSSARSRCGTMSVVAQDGARVGAAFAGAFAQVDGQLGVGFDGGGAGA